MSFLSRATWRSWSMFWVFLATNLQLALAYQPLPPIFHNKNRLKATTGTGTLLRVAATLDDTFAASTRWATELEDPIDADDTKEGKPGLLRSDTQAFTTLLMDTENYPPGSIPDLVLQKSLSILLDWARQGTVEAAQMIENILERLELENRHGVLTQRHYTVGVAAWSKSGHPEAGIRSERIINRMVDLSQSNNSLVAPTQLSYHFAILAYSRQGDIQAASQLLERMEVPSTSCYNAILTGLAKRGEARKAELVMKKMVDKCRQNEEASDCAPDRFSYNQLLDAWAKSNEPCAAERAIAILEALDAQSKEKGQAALQPDKRTYSSVICAVIRSGGPDAVEQAQRIFDQALSNGVMPDSYMHTTLLHAYAMYDPSAENTEKMLNLMEADGLACAVTWNTALKAWKESRKPGAPEGAEALLTRMKSLNIADTISYSTVIAAYAERKDKASAVRAQQLLEEMKRLYKEGNQNLKPNSQTYNIVMNAWVQCGEVLRAEELLSEMEGMFAAGLYSCRPNVVSYSTVMNGWAKSRKADGVTRAEVLFRKMIKSYEAGNKDARPNLVSYVTLINTVAKSSDVNAAERAEELLHQMYKQYCDGNGDVKPNTKLVTLVIDCWQRSGKNDAGERAEALLDWMVNIYEKDEDKSIQPNEYTFGSVISVWAKTRSFGKSTRAYRVLQKMKNLHEQGKIDVGPNTHCYTAVINSCAYCERDDAERKDAWKIALRVYKTMESSPDLSPNTVTYSVMITAIRNLIPRSSGRTKAVVSVFKQACANGRVNGLVLKRLASVLSRGELTQLFSDSVVSADGQIDLCQLPEQWSSKA